jgi:hypothetical protein
LLKARPVEVVGVSEAYTSSINPFNGERLRKVKQVVERVVKAFNPYLMTGDAHEGKGIRVVKMTNRYLVGKDALLDRDSIAPLNLVKRVMGG